MATWYAQATANWNAASQWNSVPAGGGTNGTPGAGDVCYANGKTVTVNVNVDLSPGGQIRTDAGAGTAGGGFSITSPGISLKADGFAGTTACLSIFIASGSATVTGNFTGGGTSGAAGLANNSSSASTTVNVVGNGTGGSTTSCHAFTNASGSTLNITGNVTAGSSNSAHGVNNGGAGTVVVTGNVTGGSVAVAYGLNNNSTGTATVTGSATGGSGSGAYGAVNQSTGTMTVGTAVGNDWGVGATSAGPAFGVLSVVQSSVTRVGALQFGANGMSPVSGPVKLVAATTNTVSIPNSTSGTTTFAPTTNYTDPGVNSVLSGTSYTYGGAARSGNWTAAPAASVLSTQSYGVGGTSLTGTVALPSAANVQAGVAFGAASALTGSYDPVTGNYTDPGAANVKAGTTYTFAGSTINGTAATVAGGSVWKIGAGTGAAT